MKSEKETERKREKFVSAKIIHSFIRDYIGDKSRKRFEVSPFKIKEKACCLSARRTYIVSRSISAVRNETSGALKIGSN